MELRKVTFNMSAETHDDLKRRARARGATVTDVMRRACALDKFLFDHPDGKLLMLEDGEITQVVVVD